MEFFKDVVDYARLLPTVPKFLISSIVIGACATFLWLVWFVPSSTNESEQQAAQPVSVKSHVARFRNNGEFFIFITVTNLTNKAISITHVLFERDGRTLSVAPRSRPLPVTLQESQTWQTFVCTMHLPKPYRYDALDRFIVRLSDDTKIRSTHDGSVPSNGSIPGGPILSADIEACEPDSGSDN